MKQEIAGGAALLVLATLYLVGAAGIPESTLSDEIGARGLPYLLGVLLAIVSVGIMARGVFVPASTGAGDEDISPLPRALGVLACAGLYIAAAWLAGYIIAGAVALLAVMLYEGARLTWRVVAVAVLGAAFYWLTFVMFLGVEQPVGKLFGA
ncbi:MAG: tripartite tricarboxylate transporter TctB family protein [Beijerinckiaceae bacterium]